MGLVGGAIIGVWDSFAVVIGHGPHPVALADLFYLPLYSISLYAGVGFVVMAAVGALTAFVTRVGGYHIDRPRLAGVLAGIMALLAVFLLLPEGGNWVEIVELTAISAFSGAAFAVATTRTLRGEVAKDRLAALFTAWLVWMAVCLFGVLWINSSVFPEQGFWQPANLFAKIGLVLGATALAVLVFRLSLFTFARRGSRIARAAGWLLLACGAAVAIALALVGPFDPGTTAEASQPAPTAVSHDTETAAALMDLEGKPNIIWIVMDTVRQDRLSCYGYPLETTPNIDRIAAEGVLFENAVSAAPWTLPSHASMFTSTLAIDHNATAEHRWLDDGFETVAELLRYLGYQTFGYSNNPYVAPETNLHQGFDDFVVKPFGMEETEDSEDFSRDADPELSQHLRLEQYIQDLFGGDAPLGAIIDDGARETNDVVRGWIADAGEEDEPFFIFINYMEAHAPYHAPLQYNEAYLPEGVSQGRVSMVNQDSAAYAAEAVYMSPEDLEILNALYDAEIAYLDSRIGELVDYLRESDILDDTLLIICADHGENLGDHQLVGHQLCIYDTLLEVPLIIRYPELFEAGLRVDEQVQLIDLFPTITDSIRFYRHGEQAVRGESLVGSLKQAKGRAAVSEYGIFAAVLENMRHIDPEFDTSKYGRRLKSVRDGDYKYIWASDGRDELYNIRLDPQEQNNLIESEPAKAAELKALLGEELGTAVP